MPRRHLLLTTLVIVLASAAAAAPQSVEELMKMSDQLDQLDQVKLQLSLDEAARCTRARDFPCADEQMRKAAKFAVTDGDRSRLTLARDALARERAQVAQEEQQRIEQANLREQERERERERQRRQEELEAEERDREWAEPAPAPPVNYGAAILEGFNSAMAGKERIDAIHNEAMANLQNTYAERERRERAQREAEQRRREWAREEAREEARRQAERARVSASQQQQQAMASATAAQSAAAAQSRRDEDARQAQRAKEEAHIQQLLALEQKQKREAEKAANDARIEQARADRLAKAEAEKAAKQKAELDYLQAVMRGITLRARKCPEGYYIVGKRSKVSPQVVPCIDVHYRAQCGNGGAYTDGVGENFSGLSTDCYFGDTYKIEPTPACPVDQVQVTVRKVTACGQ